MIRCPLSLGADCTVARLIETRGLAPDGPRAGSSRPWCRLDDVGWLTCEKKFCRVAFRGAPGRPTGSARFEGGADLVRLTARCLHIQCVPCAPRWIRAVCVNASKAPSRATAIKVMPQASAVRTASAVGAEIAAMTGAPIRAAF